MCYKIFIPISACFVVGSTSYNLYLSEVIDSTCKQNYIDANMGPLCLSCNCTSNYIIIGLIFIGACLKKRNEGISYDEL